MTDDDVPTREQSKAADKKLREAHEFAQEFQERLQSDFSRSQRVAALAEYVDRVDGKVREALNAGPKWKRAKIQGALVEHFDPNLPRHPPTTDAVKRLGNLIEAADDELPDWEPPSQEEVNERVDEAFEEGRISIGTVEDVERVGEDE